MLNPYLVSTKLMDTRERAKAFIFSTQESLHRRDWNTSFIAVTSIAEYECQSIFTRYF